MYKNKPLRLLEGDSGGNAAGGTSQAGEPSSTSGQEPTTTSTTLQESGSQSQQASTSTKSADDYEAIIRKLRDENAGHRKRNKELEDAESKRQEAELSAQEKAEKQLAKIQKEHEDYRTSVQERIVTTELRAAAADLGFADLSDAVRLLDRSELEFDEDGNPTNARKLLESLAKAKPYLLKAQNGGQQRTAASSGGATNPPRSATSGPQTLTREYVNALVGDKAAYDALPASEKSRISAWIQAGGLLRRR